MRLPLTDIPIWVAALGPDEPVEPTEAFDAARRPAAARAGRQAGAA